MSLIDDVYARDPVIDNQFPAPRVLESTDDIINLDVPFTMELPALDSDAYTDVLLVFVNTDGSNNPQYVAHEKAVSGTPTRAEVNNDKLSPPFDRDHSAVVRCFIRLRDSDVWQRTPDSVFYTF